MPPTWDELMAGTGCPLCAPRPSADAFKIEVARLAVSTLYLDRNQRWRGYCALIFDPRHVTGLELLTAEEAHAFSADLHRAARAITAACRPDLMNYASLGNGIPHLHWHLLPRYRSDPQDVRWGYPVWADPPGAADAPAIELSEPEYAALIAKIRAKL